MKDKLIALLVGVILLIGIIGITGGSETPETQVEGETRLVAATQTPTPTVTLTPTKAVLGWNDKLRADYMNGCLEADGSNRTYCECTLVEMEQEFTATEAMQMGVTFDQTGEMPDEFWNIVLACLQ